MYLDIPVLKFCWTLQVSILICGANEHRCIDCSHNTILGSKNEYDCSFCNILLIPDFPNSAVSIDLSFNNISRIRRTDFSKLLYLEKLSLRNNSISVIEWKSLSTLSSLRYLILHTNRLDCTSLDVLGSLQKLHYLDIRGNVYKTYPRSLSILSNLNVLKIDLFIDFHFDNSFLALKNLTEISFEPRGMVTLKNDSFEGIRNSPIKELFISLPYKVQGRIGIDFLRPFIFLKRLTLNIDGNFDIKDVLRVLYGLRNRKLEYIDISDNNWYIHRYHYLTVNDVANLFKICVKEVNLRHNGIVYFPFVESLNQANRNFSSCLEKLDISNNKMIWTFSMVFGMLYYPSLKYLDISIPFTDSMKTLSVRPPTRQFNLKMNITILGFEKLEYLDVSGIDLTHGPVKSKFLESYSLFINSPNLKSLRAADSSLEICNFDIIFKRSLSTLDMSGWDCSNLNPKFINRHTDLKWLKTSKSKLGIQLNKGGITQSMLNRLRKLEYIDLSGNNIDYLNISFFVYQDTSLKYVNLGHNNFSKIPETLIYLQKAKQIDLSYNAFNYFTKKDIRLLNSIWNSTLNLEGIKFECTCKYVDTLIWLNHSHNIRQNMACRDDTNMIILLKDIHQFQLRCVSSFWLPFATTSIMILLVIILVVALGYRNMSFVMYLFIKARRLIKHQSIVPQKDRFKYDVFVSYSHLDYDWVTGPFFRYLTNSLGLNVCMHQKDFIPGKPIAEEILRCVESSKRSIFIITRNFLGSKWSLFEMDIARHHVLQTDSDMLVVILKEEIPVHKMPPLLRKIWWRIVCLKYPKDENQRELDLFNTKLKEVFQNER